MMHGMTNAPQSTTFGRRVKPHGADPTNAPLLAWQRRALATQARDQRPVFAGLGDTGKVHGPLAREPRQTLRGSNHASAGSPDPTPSDPWANDPDRTTRHHATSVAPPVQR
jgi:hypothetical protein